MQSLVDLANHFELYAVCIRCKRMVRLDTRRLIQTVGEHCSIDEVRERVRCRTCGRRTRDIRLIYAGPCGGAGGFHYRG